MLDNSCVFCGIIHGTAPASIVHADEQAVAFMDIRPVNPGHVLVIPRTHASCLAELEPDAGAWLFRVAMRLAAALRQSSVRCEGVDLFLADGAAAGQEVFHVHLHVIPRFYGDGFGFRAGAGNFQYLERTVLNEHAAGIRAVLGRVADGRP